MSGAKRLFLGKACQAYRRFHFHFFTVKLTKKNENENENRDAMEKEPTKTCLVFQRMASWPGLRSLKGRAVRRKREGLHLVAPVTSAVVFPGAPFQPKPRKLSGLPPQSKFGFGLRHTGLKHWKPASFAAVPPCVALIRLNSLNGWSAARNRASSVEK